MPNQTRTVRFIIEVNEGRAVRSLNRVNRSMNRTERSTRRMVRTQSRLTRVLTRVGSSFIRTLGIMTLMALTVGVLAAAWSALRTVVVATVSALSEFEQRILGLQAILASSVRFVTDPIENFRNAGLVAAGVIETLALRANEMVVSLSEATIVFQTLLAVGAQRLVSETSQLVDLTVLLSNAIAGITTGQDRQRQLAEETRSLFTGQLRSTSLLARLIFRNRREMRRFFEAAEAADEVVERLSLKLRGFSLIARDLARTLSGLRTTFITLLQVIARRAFGSLLEEFENRVGDLFDEIQADVAGLNAIAARLGAAVQTFIDAFLGVIERVFGVAFSNTDDILQRITDAIPTITRGFLRILFILENVGKVVRIIGLLLSSVGAILSLVFNGLKSIFDLLVGLISLLPGAGSLVDALASKVADFDDRIALVVDNFRQIAAFANDLFFGSDVDERIEASMARFAEREASLAAQIAQDQRDQEEAQQRINALNRIDLEVQIRITSQISKQSQAVRSQVSSLLQVIRLSAQGGGLPRGIRSSLIGNASELRDLVESQIRTVGIALRRATFALSEALAPRNIADPDQVERLRLQITRLKGELSALGSDLIAITGLFADLGNVDLTALFQVLGGNVIGKALENIFNALEKEGPLLINLFEGITTSITNFITNNENLVTFIAAIGNSVAQTITQVIQSGESFGTAVRKIFGNILILMGQFAVALGTIAILAGLFTLNSTYVAIGLGLVAAGTAAIALGAALSGGGASGGGGGGGGGGGSAGDATPTSTFTQQQIETQQHFSEAAESLRESSENINAATENIQGVGPDQVLIRGAEKMGGITRVLADDARRSDRFSSTRAAARAFRGA